MSTSGLASNDQVTDTPTSNKAVLNPKTDTAGWIQNINSAVEKSQIDVILPVFELGIRKLIVHGNNKQNKN